MNRRPRQTTAKTKEETMLAAQKDQARSLQAEFPAQTKVCAYCGPSSRPTNEGITMLWLK